MSIHHCLLCMGSNYEYAANLHSARIALKEVFPEIFFGKEMETEAIGNNWLSPFGNQIAKFTTVLSVEEVRCILKQIEKNHGRTPEDKTKGIVKIDIDLLMYDKEVLKPEDMKREFIAKELNEWHILLT